MNKYLKVFGSIILFAIFTFVLARWNYADYVGNWKPSTEAGNFESLWIVSAVGVSTGIFIINSIVWVWKTLTKKSQ